MPEANQCRRPVLAGWNCATRHPRRDVCARVEKTKQETNEAHSLYGLNGREKAKVKELFLA